MANVEECRAVYKAILADPLSHDQEHFGIKTPCGTSLCIAGHAVKLFKPEVMRWIVDQEDLTKAFLEHIDPERTVEEEAREILGLSCDEAEELFLTMNNEDALRILGEYCNN